MSSKPSHVPLRSQPPRQLAAEHQEFTSVQTLHQDRNDCQSRLNRMELELQDILHAAALPFSADDPDLDWNLAASAGCNSSPPTWPDGSFSDRCRPECEKLGRYQLLELISRGGEADVYRGWDPETSRVVAVKVRPADTPLGNPGGDEVTLMTRLSHRHIAQVFDRGVSSNCQYIILEWLDGPTLDELIRIRPLAAFEVREIAVQLSGVIADIHQRGIVHLDLKPGNIFVLPRGSQLEIKLIDFGLAWEYGRRDFPCGFRWGTPGFMAPEQWAGTSENWSPATDVFGLCAVLWFLLTGQALPDSSEALRQLQLTETATLDAPAELSPLRQQLFTVCQRGLQYDPRARFRNGRELELAIRRQLRIDQTKESTVERRSDKDRGIHSVTGQKHHCSLPRRPASVGRSAFCLLLVFPSLMAGGWAWHCAGPQIQAQHESDHSATRLPHPTLIADLDVNLPDKPESRLWLWTEHAGLVPWKGPPGRERPGVIQFCSRPHGLEVSRSTGRALGVLATVGLSQKKATSLILAALNNLTFAPSEQSPDARVIVSTSQIQSFKCALTEPMLRELQDLQYLLNRHCQDFQLHLVPVPLKGSTAYRAVHINLPLTRES